MHHHKIILFGPVACGGQAGKGFDKPVDLYTSNPMILEIHDNYFLVEPNAGTQEASCSDKIQVSTQNADQFVDWQVGDFVRITYNGQSQEFYPAILGQLYQVEKRGA